MCIYHPAVVVKQCVILDTGMMGDHPSCVIEIDGKREMKMESMVFKTREAAQERAWFIANNIRALMDWDNQQAKQLKK